VARSRVPLRYCDQFKYFRELRIPAFPRFLNAPSAGRTHRLRQLIPAEFRHKIPNCRTNSPRQPLSVVVMAWTPASVQVHPVHLVNMANGRKVARDSQRPDSGRDGAHSAPHQRRGVPGERSWLRAACAETSGHPRHHESAAYKGGCSAFLPPGGDSKPPEDENRGLQPESADKLSCATGTRPSKRHGYTCPPWCPLGRNASARISPHNLSLMFHRECQDSQRPRNNFNIRIPTGWPWRTGSPNYP